MRLFEIKWFIHYLAASVFTSYFWYSTGFLLKTLLIKPSFLPVAASLGIQGHHFRQITRLAFRIEELKTAYEEIAEKFLARIRHEKSALVRDISYYVSEGRSEIHVRIDSAVAAIEQARHSLLEDASLHMKKLSRNGRKAVHFMYDSLCEEIDQSVVEFRHDLTELLSGRNQSGIRL